MWQIVAVVWPALVMAWSFEWISFNWSVECNSQGSGFWNLVTAVLFWITTFIGDEGSVFGRVGCGYSMVPKPVRALRQQHRFSNLLRQEPGQCMVIAEQAQLWVPVCSLQWAYHCHVPALVQRRGCEPGYRWAVFAQPNAQEQRVHHLQGGDQVSANRTILRLLSGTFKITFYLAFHANREDEPSHIFWCSWGSCDLLR